MALVPYVELPDMPPSVQPLMQQVPPLNILRRWPIPRPSSLDWLNSAARYAPLERSTRA